MSDIWDYFALDKTKFPKMAGTEQGELLIVGTGRNVWEEVRGLPQARNVMCINDMGMYWPGHIKHWYSNDIEQLVHWSEGRRKPLVQVYEKGWKLHSCFARPGVLYQHVHHWPLPGHGSSGLVAILVALAMGYDNITVAGVPFDNSGHFYDPPNNHPLRPGGRNWTNFRDETPDRIIERSIPLMKHKVYPLSGRLREALGVGI